MKRKEITRELARRVYGDDSEQNIQICSQLYDTLIDVVSDGLIEDGEVFMRGFLDIKVVKTAERKGRNPQTNEVVTFPAGKKIKVKLSNVFKNIVSEGCDD